MSQIYVEPSIALALPLSITNPGEITGATEHALVVGGAAGQLLPLAVAGNGELVIGSVGADPVLTTLTPGANIAITNLPGAITIAVTGLGPKFADDVFRVYDDGDNTREIAFQADQITTGNTRTITMCDQDLSLITPSFPGTVTTGGNFSMPATNVSFTEGTFRVGGQIFLQALGTGNTFLGDTTGGSLNTGQYNTGLGFRSLLNINNANYSVALGAFACTNLTDGDRNVSVGFDSLGNITDGADNIAMGDEAGSLLAGSESDNIIIGNLGTVGDNNKIRLGTTGTGPGQQNNCFIAGIYGVTPAGATQAVIIDANGELGSSDVTASLVLTDTTNFDHILSVADTTIQSALETIDDLTLSGDSGTAQAASAVFTIAGGTGITSAAAGSAVTVNLDSPVAVANGGTGVSTTTAYAVLCGGTTTTNPLQSIASVGTAGQVLTSNGAGALPTFQAAGGGGITWNEVTGTSQAAAVNNGYVANNASQVTITLPDTAAFGSVVKVMGKGAGGWKIAQNAGETIRWNESTVTTTGTGGYLESTDDHDAIELVCTTANTVWTVGPGAKGNINVV